MSVESNIKYGMGQWRYTGDNDDYYDNLDVTISNHNVSMGSELNDLYYKDNIITLDNGNFLRDVPYLLSIRIPKHPIYACSYKIKLISGNTITNSNSLLNDKMSYQLLRYISVPRQSGENKSIRVLVYKVPNSETEQTAVSRVTSNVEEIGNNDLYPNYITAYFNTQDEKYYMWKKTNDITFDLQNYEEITNFEDMLIEPNWLNQEQDTTNANNYVFYNIIFSFKGNEETISKCNTIWLEMVRNNFDYDIYNDELNNDTYYGREIPLSSNDVQLYQLNNLLSNTNIDSISHIGIYSHPDFMFAINNEELRIGQTGYFELNDYEINSIAVAPINKKIKDNMFTIDYQYPIENINTNETDNDEETNNNEETNNEIDNNE